MFAFWSYLEHWKGLARGPAYLRGLGLAPALIIDALPQVPRPHLLPRPPKYPVPPYVSCGGDCLNSA